MAYLFREIRLNADRTVLNPLLEPETVAKISITGVTGRGETVAVAPEEVRFSARPIFTYGRDEVVSVDAQGVVKPVNGGYALVEAVWTGGGYSLTASVKIIVRPFYHEYHKTITGKLFMAIEEWGSLKNPPSDVRDESVLVTFEEALDIFRRLDKITCGMPKIVYLVGWQRGGHDHGYPAFDEVNPKLKRAQDPDARTSMRWLIREAKKYNTAVSVHINASDAWSDSKLFGLYRENHILAENEDGSLKAINGFDAQRAHGGVYSVQVCLKRLWETGFFRDRIHELLALIPELADTHTIHLDNWQAVGSPRLGITQADDEEAIKEMALWLRSIGLDVTSEGSFHGRTQPMTGLQPMTWWDTPYDASVMPPSLYCGGRVSRWDADPRFGDSIQLENAVQTNLRRGRDVMDGLQEEFCLYTLPWQFLNSFLLESFDGETAVYAGGVKAYLEKGVPMIMWNDTVIRRGTTMFVPMLWKEDRQIMMYGFRDSYLPTVLPEGWEDVEAVDILYADPRGLEEPVLEQVLPTPGGRFSFAPQTRCAYIVRPHK